MQYTFKVHGYDFGELILEDVWFSCTVDTDSRIIVRFESVDDWDSDPYLQGLSQVKWITAGRDSVSDQLDRIWPLIDQGQFTADEMFTELNDDGTLEF